MEPSQTAMPPEKKKAPTAVIIAVVAVLIAIVAAAAVVFLLLNKDKAPADDPTKGFTMGYATEATVMLDQDSLQAAVDAARANAANSSVALRYKNDAYSADGTNFECYIVNSSGNIFDMYITIYADDQMTDQLYMSELVPPGSGFEKIALEKALEPGDHTVYVVVTQLDTDEDGKQFIRNQVIHTMDFHVSESE